MTLEQLYKDFSDLLEEIMYSTGNIDNPYDRVTTMQWIRKLQSIDDKTIEIATLRNQYANYLRMALDNNVVYLGAPFHQPPPDDDLRPLCEVLANYIATKCPPIPMTGPIQPVMSSVSDDGKVYTTVKQSPDGQIFCYMAVTPESFEEFK